MLRVAAGKIGDPVAAFIPVKTSDDLRLARIAH
jgi:hypothetical protein